MKIFESYSVRYLEMVEYSYLDAQTIQNTAIISL
jgi:hypothetical protein